MSSTAYGRDHEVVQRLRPEPPSAEELAADELVSGVEFDIFRHKMKMVAQEGKETTMRLGASTGMRWGDVAFGIFTAQGDLAVCATGIYFHALLGQLPIKFLVKHWRNDPSVGCNQGDSFFYNDPFYGGVHAADMGLAIPIFHAGRLICFAAAAVHTGECGGTDPGGLGNGSRSRYDDGILIPPLKVGEGYQLREDILTMLATMNRDPRTMILDIKARLAAVRVVERRIQDLIAEKGAAFFVGALRRILTVTSEAARRKVSRLNDGVFRQARFIDTLGVEPGLIKVMLTVRKKGDKIFLDFENTSPLIPDRPLNCYFQGAVALAALYLCGWFFYDLPANNGLLEAVEWKFPDDALVNAKGDATTSLAPLSMNTVYQAMFQCGARMTFSYDPERAVASWFTAFAVPFYGGLNQHGDPVADVTPEMNSCGAGACRDRDGVHSAGSFFASMSDCSDVETSEADRPFVYTFRGHFDGSYGHGKHRGGSGTGFGMMVYEVPAMHMGGFGNGSRHPATPGVFGGGAVPPVFIRTVRGSNYRSLLAERAQRPRNYGELYRPENPETGTPVYHDISMPIEPLNEGDTFYVCTGGGAGYGDALERDPRAVLQDLRDGVVSAWAARNVYFVATDEHRLRVDEEETARLRAAERAARKRRGKSWEAFHAEWNRKRPAPEVIRGYGSYPDPLDGMAAQDRPTAAA
ncbi:MAG: hydantoinase B/oxoprolinase family protein [Deltaproteobacteria bacterium]|nr:hydantoinase B/oxoprolinase family protein [Deltaproteobacteria bacterium]